MHLEIFEYWRVIQHKMNDTSDLQLDIVSSEKASNKYVRYKKVMATLSHSEIQMYREIFNYFDKNKKGYLVAEDFETVLRNLKKDPTDEEIQDLLKTHDVNGDGKITFEELVVVTVKRKKATDDESDYKKMFRKFDRDSDGVLSGDELKQCLTAFGKKLQCDSVENILKRFDKNKDDVIQYDEFVKMIIQWKAESEEQEEEEKEETNEDTPSSASCS